jgi:hypothetical protein
MTFFLKVIQIGKYFLKKLWSVFMPIQLIQEMGCRSFLLGVCKEGEGGGGGEGVSKFGGAKEEGGGGACKEGGGEGRARKGGEGVSKTEM